MLDAAARPFLLSNFTALVEFGRTTDNGRFVRNIFRRSVEIQSQRVARITEKSKEDLITITVPDVTGAWAEVLAENLRQADAGNGAWGPARAFPSRPCRRHCRLISARFVARSRNPFARW